MTRVEDSVEIDAPPRTVWNVLTDASYIVKLYPDVVTVEAEPPGPIVVGSRTKVVGKMGNIRVDVFVECTRADPESCFASRQRPGGLFSAFSQTVVLNGEGPRTRARVAFDYQLVREYAETITQEELVDARVADNLRRYTRNLKEICELLPLPS